jgi:hypothetical protein
MKDIQEPSVRQVEIRFETVDRDDYPVSVTAIPTLYGGFRVSNDGFLGERYNFSREAG